MSTTTTGKQVQTRRQHWQEMIKKQARNGLSIRAFCAQQGLRDTVFYAWRTRLRAAAPARFALVETGPGRPSTAPAVELVLSGGERLLIGAGAEAATIRAVLAALRG
ncbi:MAG TPA: hypothetical protein VI488_07495 [Candidatus Angelobacter sp.]